MSITLTITRFLFMFVGVFVILSVCWIVKFVSNVIFLWNVMYASIMCSIIYGFIRRNTVGSKFFAQSLASG